MTRWLTTIWRMPDLRSRVLFTLGMLAVFRLGVHIPAPGVDREALAELVAANENTMFGLYDMFSGGALAQYSVFVLGIMPYITSSIIIQILTVAIPTLDRLSKEGQQGRNRITQYTRYATIAVALAQGFAISVGLEQGQMGAASSVVINPGLEFRLVTMITLAAGSCFVMWLGEQISERGIGNGSSLIITAGIVSRFPAGVMSLYQLMSQDQLNAVQVTVLAGAMLLVIGLIVWIERAQLRIPVQYAKRVVGRRGAAAQVSHLPLRLNNAGVIPPIFASSVLLAPNTVLSMWQNQGVAAVAAAFAPGAWLYNYTYVALIVFFAYFYTALIFNPMDVADNLKRNGGYVPGIRPGKQTADYIDYQLTRLTGAGAVYLAAVCILPTLLITRFGVPFYFGGTGLLIVVGVSLDTVAQVEAQMLTRHYDGITGARSTGPGSGRRRLLIESPQGNL